MTANVPNSQFDQKEFEAGRKNAMIFGGAVYTGGVIVVTTLNICFILLALPATSYLVRFILVVGSILVGASMLAMPNAVHNWAVTSRHHMIALFLYYGEIAIVGINTVVSFAALLYTFGASKSIPDWVAWYEPYSIFATVYTIVAWGTLWVVDPRAKRKAKFVNAVDDFNDQVISGMTNYLGTEEGKAKIKERVDANIDANFSTMLNKPRYWNGQNDPANQAQPPALPQPPAPPVTVPQYKTCTACGSPNTQAARFCQSCGTTLIAIPPITAPNNTNGNHPTGP